jgi:8-oxo-dGTP pyrophosphatase MutT (NUDIX family)
MDEQPNISLERKRGHPRLERLLDDLCSRFIINCPPEELESFERILFQIEQAHWFYEDFYRENDKTLPNLTLKEFAILMFDHAPILRPFSDQLDEIFKNFMNYKITIPVYGGIILNKTLDKCLLVKGFNTRSWGFPKGKINKDEPEIDCAAREVYEETGFDIRSVELSLDDYIVVIVREQQIKLYIVPFVGEDTYFEPKTRKEIEKIEWLPVWELPVSYQEAKEKGSVNAGPNQAPINANSFFTVIPFVKKLRKWIRMKKRELEAEGKPLVEQAKNEKRPRSSSYNFHKNGNKTSSPVKQVNASNNTPSGSSEFKPVYKTIHSIETEMLSRSSSNIQNTIQNNYSNGNDANGEKRNPFLSFKIDMVPLMKCFETQKVK